MRGIGEVLSPHSGRWLGWVGGWWGGSLVDLFQIYFLRGGYNCCVGRRSCVIRGLCSHFGSGTLFFSRRSMAQDGFNVCCVPDGLGGNLTAVTCAREGLRRFRSALDAASAILNVGPNLGRNQISVVAGSFRGRAGDFDAAFMDYLRRLGFERFEFFDIYRVESGSWRGLRAMGFGPNQAKRWQAAKVGLALEALRDGRVRVTFDAEDGAVPACLREVYDVNGVSRLPEVPRCPSYYAVLSTVGALNLGVLHARGALAVSANASDIVAFGSCIGRPLESWVRWSFGLHRHFDFRVRRLAIFILLVLRRCGFHRDVSVFVLPCLMPPRPFLPPRLLPN